ncbi:aldehyde dehydrogenase family protein [Pseudomonas gingeri]
MNKLSSAEKVPHALMYIDGKWIDSTEQDEIRSPATEQPVATVAQGSIPLANQAVAAAKKAFDSGVWSTMHPHRRAQILLKAADRLEARSEELAALASAENGMPIRIAGPGVIGVSVEFLRYYARLSAQFEYEVEGPRFGPHESEGIIRREPVGVCAAIVPWNVPLVLGMWKIAPALAVGNSVVVKPDRQAPLTLIEFARELEAAGLPPGVLNIVTGEGAVIGAHLAEHPDVAKVAFTGSTATGRDVMRRASSTLKRVTLELGGKAPSIVLADANINLAVEGVIYGALAFSGQICESGTRLLLPRSLHDEFIDRLVHRISELRIGDPASPETDLGPVFSARQKERILAYIETGKAQGATLRYGGTPLKGGDFEQGHWVQPTIFTNVTSDMTIAREEIFGPVLSVIKYDDVDEAIQIANDSEYGLSAGIWSEDYELALSVARRIQAGTVWINDWHALPPGYPFGGYKQSGVGREAGDSALAQYTEEKFIALAPPKAPSSSPFVR